LLKNERGKRPTPDTTNDILYKNAPIVGLKTALVSAPIMMGAGYIAGLPE
jgi:hypothetical protein